MACCSWLCCPPPAYRRRDCGWQTDSVRRDKPHAGLPFPPLLEPAWRVADLWLSTHRDLHRPRAAGSVPGAGRDRVACGSWMVDRWMVVSEARCGAAAPADAYRHPSLPPHAPAHAVALSALPASLPTERLGSGSGRSTSSRCPFSSCVRTQPMVDSPIECHRSSCYIASCFAGRRDRVLSSGITVLGIISFRYYLTDSGCTRLIVWPVSLR